MPLFQILRQSFQSPNFYKSLRLRPLKASLAFFLYLTVVFSLIITFFTAGFALPKFFSWAGNLGGAVADGFPDNLSVTIRDGVISTNATSSVAVPAGDKLRDETMDWSGPVVENLLVVDAGSGDSVKSIDDTHALVFVGRDGIALRTEAGTVFQPAKDMPDAEIKKSAIESLRNFFRAPGIWLGPIVTCGIFLGVLFLELSVLLDLILGAFIVRLVARARGTLLSYKEAYQASVHLGAAALTVYLVFGVLILGMITPFFPFLLIVLAFGAWTNYPPGGRKKKNGGKNVSAGKNNNDKKEVPAEETKENEDAKTDTAAVGRQRGDRVEDTGKEEGATEDVNTEKKENPANADDKA